MRKLLFISLSVVMMASCTNKKETKENSGIVTTLGAFDPSAFLSTPLRSDMYEFDGQNNTQQLQCMGISAIGDNGTPEQWYFSASSTATDNGTTVIKPTAISGPGRWLFLYKASSSGSGTDTAISSGARSLNTAYQISTTNRSKIIVSAQILCTLSLTSGASGQVILETSANGTTGWTYAGQISGSNTGTLTVGLNTSQLTGGQLEKDLPVGHFWRLRTNNVTGTPTYTFQGGVQTVY